MEKVFRVMDAISAVDGKAGQLPHAGLVVAICYDVTLRYVSTRLLPGAFDITYMVYGAYACWAWRTARTPWPCAMDLVVCVLSPRPKLGGRDLLSPVVFSLPHYPDYKCGDHALWSLHAGERSSGSVWRPLWGRSN